MMDFYKDLEPLFQYDPLVLKTTSKKEYLDIAAAFWQSYSQAFEAFGESALASGQPLEEAIAAMTSFILELAKAHLPKSFFKGKKTMQNMDDALFMVTYVLPALNSYNNPVIGVSPSNLTEGSDAEKISECFKQLASSLSTGWAETFKGKPLGIATTLEIANAYGEHILRKSFAQIRKNKRI